MFLNALGRERTLASFKRQRITLNQECAWQTSAAELLVQIGVVPPHSLALSLCAPTLSTTTTTTTVLADRNYWRRVLSRLPGGLVALPRGTRQAFAEAPSSAYLKLLHAEALLGARYIDKIV